MRLQGLGIETVETDTPLWLRALQLARQTGLTVYGATYPGLAAISGAELTTLDDRLAAASSTLGLPMQASRRK